MSVSSLFELNSEDLNRRAGKSTALNLAARGFSILSQFVTFAVLARLLTPADFGLVAMALPLVAVLLVVGDLGLSKWTLQAPTISEEQASSLFFLSLAAGVVIAALCIAVSPLLALLYDEPRVAAIASVLALQFVLAGMRSQHKALLQRALRFRHLSQIEIVSSLIATVGAVWMAWQFETYWAFVARFLIQSILQTLGTWMAARWKPKFIFWTPDTARMLRFGGAIMGGFIFNTVGRQMDTVLIGWRWGEAALGIYAFAYRIFLLPVQQLSNPLSEVLIPALSRLREQHEQCRKLFRTALKGFGLVAVPPFVAIAVCAEEVILVVAGDQWLAAALVLKVLAPLGALHVYYSPIGWLMVAFGRADRYFLWTVVLTPIYLTAFVVGLPWGPFGVACAYAVAHASILLPSWFYGTRGTAIRMRDALGAMVPSLALGGATALLTLPAKMQLAASGPLVVLSSAVVVVLLMWLVGAGTLIGFRRVRDNANLQSLSKLLASLGEGRARRRRH